MFFFIFCWRKFFGVLGALSCGKYCGMGDVGDFGGTGVFGDGVW